MGLSEHRVGIRLGRGSVGIGPLRDLAAVAQMAMGAE